MNCDISSHHEDDICVAMLSKQLYSIKIRNLCATVIHKTPHFQPCGSCTTEHETIVPSHEYYLLNGKGRLS